MSWETKLYAKLAASERKLKAAEADAERLTRERDTAFKLVRGGADAYEVLQQRAEALAALVRDIALREKDLHSRDRWLYSCKLEEVEWIARAKELLND